MLTEFKLKVPEEAECTLTITAPVGILRRLRDQIEGAFHGDENVHLCHYPIDAFLRSLADVISKAEKGYFDRAAKPTEG